MAILHFRVDISDTLMYVYEMLGAELLSNLYDRLGRQLMDPQQSAVWQVNKMLTENAVHGRVIIYSGLYIFCLDLTSHFVFVHLKDTEALLFGFQSIAETIDVNYSDVIPGLIGLIPRINISNVMLADTVMYTIGTLTPVSHCPCSFLSQIIHSYLYLIF